MPGLAGQVFRITKNTYGLGKVPHHPCERNEFAGVYAGHFSRILRSTLEKLPSFKMTGFKGPLITREIAPGILSAGVAVEFKATSDLGTSKGINQHFSIFEHQLMTEIFKAIDEAPAFKKLFKNGDLQDVYFGIEQIRDVESNIIVGLSVHFVVEGQIVLTKKGYIPAGRLIEILDSRALS